MAPPDIDLIKMAHPPITRGDGDVFELYVHVVLSYMIDRGTISIASQDPESTKKHIESGIAGRVREERTFDQFAPVHLARCDLKRYDMILCAITSAFLENLGSEGL